MAVTPPDWVRGMILAVTGVPWPGLDEDRTWAAGKAYEDAAKILQTDVGPSMVTAIRGIRGALGGKTEEAFVASMAKFVEDDPKYLDTGTDTMNQVASYASNTAEQAQYFKLTALLTMIALMIELAQAAIEAFFDPIGAAVEEAAAIATTRMIIRQLLKEVLEQLIKLEISSIVFQEVIDAAAQLIQMAMGTRKNWDWSQTGQAAIAGAVAGGAGLILGPAAKGLGKGLGKAGANDTVNHIVTGMASSVAGEYVGGGLANEATGGGWSSWSDASSGAVEGAAEIGGRRGGHALAGSSHEKPDDITLKPSDLPSVSDSGAGAKAGGPDSSDGGTPGEPAPAAAQPSGSSSSSASSSSAAGPSVTSEPAVINLPPAVVVAPGGGTTSGNGVSGSTQTLSGSRSPVEDVPKPTVQPSPIESQPVPVESQPAAVHSQPAPIESQPTSAVAPPAPDRIASAPPAPPRAPQLTDADLAELRTRYPAFNNVPDDEFANHMRWTMMDKPQVFQYLPSQHQGGLLGGSPTNVPTIIDDSAIVSVQPVTVAPVVTEQPMVSAQPVVNEPPVVTEQPVSENQPTMSANGLSVSNNPTPTPTQTPAPMPRPVELTRSNSAPTVLQNVPVSTNTPPVSTTPAVNTPSVPKETAPLGTSTTEIANPVTSNGAAPATTSSSTVVPPKTEAIPPKTEVITPKAEVITPKADSNATTGLTQKTAGSTSNTTAAVEETAPKPAVQPKPLSEKAQGKQPMRDDQPVPPRKIPPPPPPPRRSRRTAPAGQPTSNNTQATENRPTPTEHRTPPPVPPRRRPPAPPVTDPTTAPVTDTTTPPVPTPPAPPPPSSGRPDELAPYFPDALGLIQVTDPGDVNQIVAEVNRQLGTYGAKLPESSESGIVRNLTFEGGSYFGEGKTEPIVPEHVDGSNIFTRPSQPRSYDVTIRAVPGHWTGAVTDGDKKQKVTQPSGHERGNATSKPKKSTKGLPFAANVLLAKGVGVAFDLSFSRAKAIANGLKTNVTNSNDLSAKGVSPVKVPTTYHVSVVPSVRPGETVPTAPTGNSVQLDLTVSAPNSLRGAATPGTTTALDPATQSRLATAQSLAIDAVTNTHGLGAVRQNTVPKAISEPGDPGRGALFDLSNNTALQKDLTRMLQSPNDSDIIPGKGRAWTVLRSSAAITSLTPLKPVDDISLSSNHVVDKGVNSSIGITKSGSVGVGPAVGLGAGPFAAIGASIKPNVGGNVSRNLGQDSGNSSTHGISDEAGRIMYRATVQLTEQHLNSETGQWTPGLNNHPVDVVLSVSRVEAERLRLPLPDDLPAHTPKPDLTGTPQLPSWLNTDTTGKLTDINLPNGTSGRVRSSIDTLLAEHEVDDLLPPRAGSSKPFLQVSSDKYNNDRTLNNLTAPSSLKSMVPQQVTLTRSTATGRQLVTVSVTPLRTGGTFSHSQPSQKLNTQTAQSNKSSMGRAWEGIGGVSADIRLRALAKPVGPVVAGNGKYSFNQGKTGSSTTKLNNQISGSANSDVFHTDVEFRVDVKVEDVPFKRLAEVHPGVLKDRFGNDPLRHPVSKVTQSGQSVTVTNAELAISQTLSRSTALANAAAPGPVVRSSIQVNPTWDGRTLLNEANDPTFERISFDPKTVAFVARREQVLTQVTNLINEVGGPAVSEKLGPALNNAFGPEAVDEKFGPDGWSQRFGRRLNVTVRPRLSNTRPLGVVSSDATVQSGVGTAQGTALSNGKGASVGGTVGPFGRPDNQASDFVQMGLDYKPNLSFSQSNSAAVNTGGSRSQTSSKAPRMGAQNDVTWDVIVEYRPHKSGSSLVGSRQPRTAARSFTVPNGTVRTLDHAQATTENLVSDDFTQLRADHGLPSPPATTPTTLHVPVKTGSDGVTRTAPGHPVEGPDLRPLLKDLRTQLGDRAEEFFPTNTRDWKGNWDKVSKFLASPSTTANWNNLVDGKASLPLFSYKHNTPATIEVNLTTGTPTFDKLVADGSSLKVGHEVTTGKDADKSFGVTHTVSPNASAGGTSEVAHTADKASTAGSGGGSRGWSSSTAKSGSAVAVAGASTSYAGPRGRFTVPISSATLTLHHDGAVAATTTSAPGRIPPVTVDHDAGTLRTGPTPVATAAPTAAPPIRALTQAAATQAATTLTSGPQPIPSQSTVENFHGAQAITDLLNQTLSAKRTGTHQQIDQYINANFGSNDGVRGWLALAGHPDGVPTPNPDAKIYVGLSNPQLLHTGGGATQEFKDALGGKVATHDPGLNQIKKTNASQRNGNAGLSATDVPTNPDRFTASGPGPSTIDGELSGTTQPSSGGALGRSASGENPSVIMSYDLDVVVVDSSKIGGHSASITLPGAVDLRMSETIALAQPNPPTLLPGSRQPDHKPLQEAVEAQDKALWTVRRLQLERQAATNPTTRTALDEQLKAAVQDYDAKAAATQAAQSTYLTKKERSDRYVAGTATAADHLSLALETAPATSVVPPAPTRPAPPPPGTTPPVPTRSAPPPPVVDPLRQRFDNLRGPRSNLSTIVQETELTEPPKKILEMEDETERPIKIMETEAGPSVTPPVETDEPVDPQLAELAQASFDLLERLPAVPTTPLVTQPVSHERRPFDDLYDISEEEDAEDVAEDIAAGVPLPPTFDGNGRPQHILFSTPTRLPSPPRTNPRTRHRERQREEPQLG